jgi:hypothetical protein
LEDLLVSPGQRRHRQVQAGYPNGQILDLAPGQGSLLFLVDQGTAGDLVQGHTDAFILCGERKATMRSRISPLQSLKLTSWNFFPRLRSRKTVQVSASPQSSSNYVVIALSDYERANVHLALEIVPLLAGLRHRVWATLREVAEACFLSPSRADSRGPLTVGLRCGRRRRRRIIPVWVRSTSCVYA